ncbi:MAG: 50S ribosomal protein L18Ae [Candidatus Hodarchaeales archaeon]|jgi:large subunit ribosomal protein LX
MSKSEIKNFRIMGSFTQHGKKVTFKREIRSLNEDNAIENVYLFFGSKHRIKRAQIKILEVKEINKKDITDKLVQEFATNKDISIRR